MKKENLLLTGILVLLVAGILLDRLYVSRFKEEFKAIEQERIAVSNKLATAKIVSENLNHVRDLVFKNMTFDQKNDIAQHETVLFDFITTCVNDLKLELISVEPVAPKTNGAITEIGYDIRLMGDFFSFGELCAKFENSRRIITLQSFEVKQHSEADGGRRRRNGFKNIDITMRLNTFRIKKG